LAALRQLSAKETFLGKDAYTRLCREQEIVEEKEQAALLGLLDSLGLVLHFEKIAGLSAYLLNPRWLTYGVYEVLNKKQSHVNQQDAIAWLRQAQVWDNLGNPMDYPAERCGFLLDAMESFQVAYRLPPPPGGAPTFVIPSLFPTDEPAFDFPEQEARAFRFRFPGLIPPHLLPRLIVARHADIEEQGGEPLAWRSGWC
jgi:hypothetical protein